MDYISEFLILAVLLSITQLCYMNILFYMVKAVYYMKRYYSTFKSTVPLDNPHVILKIDFVILPYRKIVFYDILFLVSI